MGDFVGYQEVWQYVDVGIVEYQVVYCQGVVCQQVFLGLYCGMFVLVFEGLGLGCVQVGMVDLFVMCQVVWLEYWWQVGEVFWCCYGNLLEVVQFVGMQVGVVWLVDMYCEIDVLVDQIVELVIGQYFYLDFGKLLDECCGNVVDVLFDEVLWCGDV